jgi:hypothetical protein
LLARHTPNEGMLGNASEANQTALNSSWDQLCINDWHDAITDWDDESGQT